MDENSKSNIVDPVITVERVKKNAEPQGNERKFIFTLKIRRLSSNFSKYRRK